MAPFPNRVCAGRWGCVAPFKLAYGIACAAAGRLEIARDIPLESVANRFTEIAFDHVWLTTIIGYAVLAIELADSGAAALLMPIVEPYAEVVAFNGATSQGPVAACVGKLASLLDRHEVRAELDWDRSAVMCGS